MVVPVTAIQWPKAFQPTFPGGRRCRPLVLASISVFDGDPHPATPSVTDGRLRGQMRFAYTAVPVVYSISIRREGTNHVESATGIRTA